MVLGCATEFHANIRISHAGELRRWLESQGICQRLGGALWCVVAGRWNL